ncbi:hypothetical protein TSPI_08717 [Trichinella spiralis]
MILVHEHRRFKGDSSVMDTQPRSYGLYEFDIAEDDSSTSPTRISGRFPNNGHPAAYQFTAIGQQRSAYFFPLTREQPLHQCECAVEFRYNIRLGILNFYPSRSYGLYEFDIAEDDSSTSPTRISGRFLYNGHPAAYQFTAIGQQRSAYFFPLTREQPLHQCECAVEFRYNITLGILHFYPSRSYGLYEFDIAEDDSSTSPTRISGRFPNNGHPAAYQFTAIGQQRSAYFFPLTREQPLHQCECAVEFRYNITLGILHFYPSRSYGLYEFDIAEDDSSTSPTRISGRFLIMDTQRHISLQLLVTSNQLLEHWKRPTTVSHTVGIGILVSTHCSCIPYEFAVCVNEFGKYQRSAYFFPLTREQPLHQCECAVEFRYNITLGILHFYPSRSYGLYEFDIAEDDSSTSPTRISGRFPNNGHPAAYQFTAIGQQPLHQCECAVEFRYNIRLGILNFYPSRSYGLYEFDIAEDDSSTSPTRISGRFPNNGHPAAYQFTAIGQQRSAYFFPLTREQPLHQCECAVEFRYNIGLGILNFYPSRSYGLYEFDIAEDDSSTFLPGVLDGCTIC